MFFDKHTIKNDWQYIIIIIKLFEFFQEMLKSFKTSRTAALVISDKKSCDKRKRNLICDTFQHFIIQAHTDSEA